jgi:hypothetical protein
MTLLIAFVAGAATFVVIDMTVGRYLRSRLYNTPHVEPVHREDKP